MWYETEVQLHSSTRGYQHLSPKTILSPLKGLAGNYNGLFLNSQFCYLQPVTCRPGSNHLAYRGRAVGFKIGSVSPPTLLFFKFFWLFWVPCILHEFQDQLVNFRNKGSWDSDRGCPEPADQFREP